MAGMAHLCVLTVALEVRRRGADTMATVLEAALGAVTAHLQWGTGPVGTSLVTHMLASDHSVPWNSDSVTRATQANNH